MMFSFNDLSVGSVPPLVDTFSSVPPLIDAFPLDRQTGLRRWLALGLARLLLELPLVLQALRNGLLLL